MDYKSRYN